MYTKELHSTLMHLLESHRQLKKEIEDLKNSKPKESKEKNTINTMHEYILSKEINPEELRKYFTRIFRAEGGFSFSRCPNCGDTINIKELPSVSWTRALYCWNCKSISMLYITDRMSGSNLDQIEIFQERG